MTSSDFHDEDPFPTLFDFKPTAIEDNIVKGITDLYRDCLVSFLLPKEHHPGQYHSIGTGFFAFSPDPTRALLMTAKHVLESFDFVSGRITIDTRVFSVGDVGLRQLDPHLDIAQWSIPSNVLIEAGVGGIPALPCLGPKEASHRFEPMDSFVLLGYPWSKNKRLDFREKQSPERSIFGLALHRSKLSESGRIRELHYTGRGTPEAWNESHMNPPHLRGMSGAPCLRLVRERSSLAIGAVLAGVFYAWDKQTHKLEVVSFADPWRVNLQ